MGYTNDALKVYHKSHQLFYLPKNAAILQHTYMHNYLKSSNLGVCITAMHLMKLSENMKYLAKKHPGPKQNKLLDNVKLFATLLCKVPDTGNPPNG